MAQILTSPGLAAGTVIHPLPTGIKWSFVTGIVPAEHLEAVSYDGERVPKAGDVVLARVTAIERHKDLELPNGRKAQIHPGDLVGVACGNRYATDQFEGYVPKGLGPCHLLSVGGVCGEVVSRSAICPAPTSIELLGYIHSGSGPVNLRSFGLSPVSATRDGAKVLLVTGNAMNSGKTTTAVSAIRYLVREGFKVAAGKVTGTGCGHDPFQLTDAGAEPVLDFLSAGYPSTYLCSREELLHIYRTVLSNLLLDRPDFVVLEVADGLLQQETACLLDSPEILSSVDYVIHGVVDALSIKTAVDILRERGLNVIALSGVISNSALAIKEAAYVTHLPVLTAEQIASGGLRQLSECGRKRADTRARGAAIAPSVLVEPQSEAAAHVAIREARPENCEDVLVLWRETGSGPSVTDTVEHLCMLTEKSRDLFLLAEADGRLVGSVLGGWDYWRGHIYRLAVHPDYRRRGVARALTAEIERRLGAKGARRIYALASTKQDTGVAFWESLRYKRAGSVPYYRTFRPRNRIEGFPPA